MNRRPGNNNISKHEKDGSAILPIMDIFFEEEDSTDSHYRDNFSAILSHDDIKFNPKTDISKTPSNDNDGPKEDNEESEEVEEVEEINEDADDNDENEEYHSEDAPHPIHIKKYTIDDIEAPDDIKEMIRKDEFYPFNCKGMKKNIITTNKILYLLQRMNTLTMEQCIALTGDDSRRIYDVMNILAQLGLVEKVRRDVKTLPKNYRRKKVPCSFKFCSNIKTDEPIDFKKLKDYMS